MNDEEDDDDDMDLDDDVEGQMVAVAARFDKS